MNNLLKQYIIDVDYPEVSGVEHLQMLVTRSQLAAIEAQLSEEEQQMLAAADHKLVVYAKSFLAELNRFVNLNEERQQRRVDPAEWWWYLDVLAQAPTFSKQILTSTLVPA